MSLTSELTDMEEEEEEVPSISAVDGETEKVVTWEAEKEESFQETTVTSATTVYMAPVRHDVEEEEVECKDITEDEKEERKEKDDVDAESEGRDEEDDKNDEKSEAKRLLGVWESEVRTLKFDFPATVKLINIQPK